MGAVGILFLFKKMSFKELCKELDFNEVHWKDIDELILWCDYFKDKRLHKLIIYKYGLGS